MSILKAVIVDDEPLAIEVLLSHLKSVPYVEVVATCRNALEAYAAVTAGEVDVLLLDINMPEITGITFLRSLSKPPMVIFTTAYADYALESYELSAVDYLLKPVSFNRLMKAIQKAYNLKFPGLHQAAAVETQEQMLFVRSEGKWVRIDISKVWLVEGLKDYVRIWSDDGRMTIHSTMKNLEEQLRKYNDFVRVHKSYIVNLKFVSETDGNTIKVKDQVIAVGGTYKEEVQKRINTYRIN